MAEAGTGLVVNDATAINACLTPAASVNGSGVPRPWLAAREAAVKRTSFFAHILMLSLRPLSVLADPPRIPRHLLNPAGPHKSQRQPVNAKPNPTFKIAGGDGDACEAGTEHATIPTSIATSPRRVSAREIGRRLGVARSTVQDNLKRAAAAGLAWPLAEDVTDEALSCSCWGAPESRPADGDEPSRNGQPGARAETARRDNDGPLGGIPGDQPRGLRI